MEQAANSTLHVCLNSIYDAAVNPALWPDALEATNAFVGSTSTMLLDVSRGGPGPATVKATGGKLARSNSNALDDYLSAELPRDFHGWNALQQSPALELLVDSTMFPDIQNRRQHPDFEFLIRKLGVFRRMATRLGDQHSGFQTVSFQFSSDRTDIPGASIRKAREVLPHMQRALDMNYRLSSLKQRSRTVFDLLNQMPFGVCIVRSDMTVVDANTEAWRIFEQQKSLYLDASRRLNGPSADAIKKSVRLASSAICLAGPYLPQTALLNTAHGPGTLIVDVTPMRDPYSASGAQSGVAVLTILDPDSMQGLSVARLSQIYKLSKTESIVCQMLVNGESNRKIAEQRNVAIDTVKSQVRSVMHKTNTSRRLDLVRLAIQLRPAADSNSPP